MKSSRDQELRDLKKRNAEHAKMLFDLMKVKAVYKEALKFYAEPTMYEKMTIKTGDETFYGVPVMQDKGTFARAALESAKI